MPETNCAGRLRSGLVLVGVLMMVACANTGGLLVARFAARRTEFGVRIAIGAGHGRLVRQLIVEALMLAVLAGGGGAGDRAGSRRRCSRPRSRPASAPVAFEVRFDWRLIAFTMLDVGRRRGRRRQRCRCDS